MKDPMFFTLSIWMAQWHYKSHLWFRSVLTLDASALFTNLKGGLPLHLQGSYPHKDTLYAVHCTRSFFIFYFFVIITWLGRFTFFLHHATGILSFHCWRFSFFPSLLQCCVITQHWGAECSICHQILRQGLSQVMATTYDQSYPGPLTSGLIMDQSWIRYRLPETISRFLTILSEKRRGFLRRRFSDNPEEPRVV